MDVLFLSLDETIHMHEAQIEVFGGSYGLRDRGLLEAAINMPMASFGGQFLHSDIFEMAAAYMYHIIKNHPFIDGNKRTGTVVALTFLVVNGVKTSFSQEELFGLVVGIANSSLSKEYLISKLKMVSQ
jgi:death on curing protein